MDIKQKALKLLKFSEKYTKTDMTYFTQGNFWLLFLFLLALAQYLHRGSAQ